MKTTRLFFLSLILPVANALAAEALPETVDYNRDIKPILSNICYACHGPDAKQVKGGLRLDSFYSRMSFLIVHVPSIVFSNSA